MEYLDFELRIGAGNRTEYPVTVIHAAAGGEPTIMAQIPVNDATLRRHLDELTAIRSAHAAARSATTTRSQQLFTSPHLSEPTMAREIGQRLFAALIAGTVRDAYASSLVRARAQGAGLRLRLSIDAPEVAVLPWEFLYDPQEGDHVSLLRELPLTRYTPLTRDRDSQTIKPPVRILGMVAAPSDLPQLDITQEQARMAQALEHRLERGDVELHWVQGGTWHDLQSALDREAWHVFHFIGHGLFDAGTGEGLLAFCNEQGTMHPMVATALGRLFSGHRSLRLAFLNACEGGRTSGDELFSSVGAVLTRRGVPAVISMQFDISDRAALEFSRLFYDALARGNPVDVAVTVARTGLSFAAPQSVEWATPMLHMHAPDGHLFTVDASATIFDASKPVPQPVSNDIPLRHATASTPATAEKDKQERDNLDILRDNVQEFWIEGVLEQSIYHHMLHNLDMESYIERPDEPSRPLAQGQLLVDVFDEYDRSLLLLGEPGSGKTTTMLELAHTLLQRIAAQTGSSQPQPVPVIFNLSSWSPTFARLEDWLAAQMNLQYQIPRVNGRALLAAGAILPLLDGLDETGADVRACCIEAINGYIEKRNRTGLVVCCRLKEYVALPLRLALNTAVRLTELRDDQIDTYLAAAGGQLAGLRDLLRRETAMRFDARSPLWLNLMARTYSGIPRVDLAHKGEGNVAARRQLMDDYIERALESAQGKNASTPFDSKEQATAWLAWLAHNMQRHNLTIFQIEILQPDWLVGRQETAPHLFLTRALWGIMSGLIFSLMFGLIISIGSGFNIGLLDGLNAALGYGSLFGLLGGLLGGLFEFMAPIQKLDSKLGNDGSSVKDLFSGTVTHGLIFSLIFGLTFGFIYGLEAGLEAGLNVGLAYGLSIGLIFGFIRTARITLRDRGRHLRIVEPLHWSWPHGRQYAIFGLFFGLIWGLIFGLLRTQSNGLGGGLIFGLSMGVGSGLILGLMFGLLGGFQPGEPGLKTIPNEGVMLTTLSAVKIGYSAGLIVGLLVGVLTASIETGWLYGVVTFLIFRLWYGHLDTIEHNTIRRIIARRGHAPLNYARFLDYAAEELNFLQKVGGGYVFVHRYLLEHFAEIAIEKGYVEQGIVATGRGVDADGVK